MPLANDLATAIADNYRANRAATFVQAFLCQQYSNAHEVGIGQLRPEILFYQHRQAGGRPVSDCGQYCLSGRHVACNQASSIIGLSGSAKPELPGFPLVQILLPSRVFLWNIGLI